MADDENEKLPEARNWRNLTAAEQAEYDAIGEEYRLKQSENDQWRRDEEKKLDPTDETARDELLERWRKKFKALEREQNRKQAAIGPQCYFVILNESRAILEEHNNLTPGERNSHLERHQRHKDHENYVYRGRKIEICTDLDDPPKVTVRTDWLQGYRF